MFGCISLESVVCVSYLSGDRKKNGKGEGERNIDRGWTVGMGRWGGREEEKESDKERVRKREMCAAQRAAKGARA